MNLATVAGALGAGRRDPHADAGARDRGRPRRRPHTDRGARDRLVERCGSPDGRTCADAQLPRDRRPTEVVLVVVGTAMADETVAPGVHARGHYAARPPALKTAGDRTWRPLQLSRLRGRSSAAEHQLPKLRTRVRFSSPALSERQSASPARPCFQYPCTVATARANKSPLVEEVVAGSVHRRRLACGPDPRALRGASKLAWPQPASAQGALARLARATRSASIRGREREHGVGLGDFHVHVHSDRRRHPFEQLADRRERGLVPRRAGGPPRRGRSDSRVPAPIRPQRRPAPTLLAHSDATPPSCTTISTSSSRLVRRTAKGSRCG